MHRNTETCVLFHRFFFVFFSGLFFVVDSGDVERLAECRETLKNVLGQDEMRGVPLVVMANKQDMPHALTISEITTKLDLRKLCAQRDWHVQGTSATSGAGICEALEAMAKFVGKRNLWYLTHLSLGDVGAILKLRTF